MWYNCYNLKTDYLTLLYSDYFYTRVYPGKEIRSPTRFLKRFLEYCKALIFPSKDLDFLNF